jgi:hypothetical protein
LWRIGQWSVIQRRTRSRIGHGSTSTGSCQLSTYQEKLRYRPT